MRNALPTILFSLVLAILGCRDNDPTSSTKADLARNTVGPTTAPTSFVSKPLGISLTWPSGWRVQPSPDYVLMLVGALPGQSISLDIPDLPVHLPGMIPMRLVKNGYLDDLRKRFGQLNIIEDAPQVIPGANARLVHTTWSNSGHNHAEVTLLLVHADRVYIIRANSPAEGYADTRAAFDAVVQSLRWVKESK